VYTTQQPLKLPFFLQFQFQGSSISGPRAKAGLRRQNNWPAEQRQNAEEIYYVLPVLAIYIFIVIINEKLIFVKFSSVMQDAV